MDRFATNENFTFGLLIVAGKNIRDDGLARAIFPKQGMYLTRAHIEIQLVENQMLPDTRKALRQSPSLQQDLAFFDRRFNRSVACHVFTPGCRAHPAHWESARDQWPQRQRPV